MNLLHLRSLLEASSASLKTLDLAGLTAAFSFTRRSLKSLKFPKMSRLNIQGPARFIDLVTSVRCPSLSDFHIYAENEEDDEEINHEKVVKFLKACRQDITYVVVSDKTPEFWSDRDYNTKDEQLKKASDREARKRRERKWPLDSFTLPRLSSLWLEFESK